jgi:hypothetical protein
MAKSYKAPAEFADMVRNFLTDVSGETTSESFTISVNGTEFVIPPEA